MNKALLLALSLTATAPQTPTPPAAASAPASAPAAPAAPTPAAPGWTPASWATASYTIAEPVWRGNPNLVSAEQRAGIITALKNDAAGAIKRRYPSANIVAADVPGAVKVTPTLQAPGALVPWATLGLSLTFSLPGGQEESVSDSFGLLTLWQQGSEAANFAYDQLAKRLP